MRTPRARRSGRNLPNHKLQNHNEKCRARIEAALATTEKGRARLEAHALKKARWQEGDQIPRQSSPTPTPMPDTTAHSSVSASSSAPTSTSSHSTATHQHDTMTTHSDSAKRRSPISDDGEPPSVRQRISQDNGGSNGAGGSKRSSDDLVTLFRGLMKS